MTPEIIAIVTVGVALAGVILSFYSWGTAGHDAVGVAAGWENRSAEHPALVNSANAWRTWKGC